jgi:hypothetical protein
MGEAAMTPKLLAYIVGESHMTVWCRYCERWHVHGFDGDLASSTGDRVAHCLIESSPYRRSGYVLSYGGRLEDREAPELHIQRRRRRRAA